VIAFNAYGDSSISDRGNGAVIITYADPPYNLLESTHLRTADTITFSWTEGVSDGGTPVMDYRISSDSAIGLWSEIASGITTEYYTVTGLTAGLTYKFRIEAQNAFGYSAHSSETSILCATVPSKIQTPTTTNAGPNIIFDWDEPSNNGLPITLYKVYIRKADLVYIIDPFSCDGTSSSVIVNSQCSVPIANLIVSPFVLFEGYTVNIKVIATNAYGDSEISDPGTGAVI
jgi:hypothetical protein